MFIVFILLINYVVLTVIWDLLLTYCRHYFGILIMSFEQVSVCLAVSQLHELVDGLIYEAADTRK